MAKQGTRRPVNVGYRQGRTILVVDDESVIRDLLRRTLLREGFQVVTASDGAEALARLESARIDVLITDIVMPTMDGRELLKRVNREYPHVPVISITGQASKAVWKHSGKSDSETYIVKPFKNRDIRMSLQLAMLKLRRSMGNS